MTWKLESRNGPRLLSPISNQGRYNTQNSDVGESRPIQTPIKS